MNTDQSDKWDELMRCDGEKRWAENSQSACVQLVDGPLFLRIISRESPQQYTRLFTISTVYSTQSSFTWYWDGTRAAGGSADGAGVGDADGAAVGAAVGAVVGGGRVETSETEKS